ncbi:hypothetical protein BGZ61DRAFT_447143 [Ilyonectria robusta]|uniref:uncharacterized protein n=1 Tax=Ilyonectria robusta TaxID=1079257 RepID=UPI001E8CB9DC|nr:uncharacterized protein BGZ61DRAFT_447143 [Ilyonectria robusta]KAH8729905.1 hypothetical protein BGZ61DRAFT_447143 [Ilyonectria robusta]
MGAVQNLRFLQHHSPVPAMRYTVPIKASPENHVMGCNLEPYVTQKVHQDLLNEAISRILVTGAIRRHPPASVAVFEQDRLFDFRRPTTSPIDSTAVQLNCFPNQNLVLHYASLIATYLELCGRNPGIVQLSLPEPAETARYMLESNLQSIGHIDIAIIGDVQYLKELSKGQWQGNGGSEHDIFRWNKFQSPKGKTVALVGCQEKIWGDAGDHLVRTLHAQSNIECVIYIGKAGCLQRGYTPNEWIATGDQAFVENETITWRNPLEMVIKSSTAVAHGSIVTVPTTLCETHEWLGEWSLKALSVDCEVGYIAKAAAELDIAFGFLNIVSDNLYQTGGEDLSNEESHTVISKRERLYKEITKIINSFLSLDN